MNIADFRKEYAEYNDVPDAALAGMLHQSLFSDIPREHFDGVFMGQEPPEAAEQQEDPTTEGPVTAMELSDITGPLPGKMVVMMDDGSIYAIDYQAIDPLQVVTEILQGHGVDIDSAKAEEAQEEKQEPTEATDPAQEFPLEYASNNVPTDPNRLNFEIGLMKNKKTSKAAVLLPPDITGPHALQIAKNAGVRVLRMDDGLYLFDPKQISEPTLRKQIKAGRNGHALGYGTDSIPENGVPYAVDLDGHGTLDRAEILQLRDNSRLGFSGVAPDMDAAHAKIREMGRDDAEIRGSA